MATLEERYAALRGEVETFLKAYDSADPVELAIIVARLDTLLEKQSQPFATFMASDDLRQHPGDALDALTSGELDALRERWYQLAQESGLISACYLIGCELGKDPASPGYVSTYGPKRLWSADGVNVYVDGYGHYMTVFVDSYPGGKRVLSTHRNDRLLIPGEWVSVIEKYLPEANERKAKRDFESAERDRQQRLNELSEGERDGNA